MKVTSKIMVAPLLCLASISSQASTLSEIYHKLNNVSDHIEQALNNLDHPLKKGLQAIYKDRDYQSIWVQDKDRYIPLLERLTNADSHGLKPQDYQLEKISTLLSEWGGEEIAELDLLFSVAFIAYAEDMVNGRFDPEKIGDQWFIEQPTYKPLRDLYRISNNNGDNTERQLTALEPPFKAYQALREQLAYFQALVLGGGWPTLDGTGLLEQGDTNPEIATLRKRLALAQVIVDKNQHKKRDESSLFTYLANIGKGEDGKGFLGTDIKSAWQNFQQNKLEKTNDKTTDKDPNFFDSELASALKTYQQQHGLEPDGLLGPTSRKMLNIDADARFRQILLNLERFRWLPRKLPEDYVWVDVAAYQMSVIFDKKPAMNSAVIVGKGGRQTPAFQDEIRYLEFNPYWNIPGGILYKDIIPKVKKDPKYLSKKNIKVFEGWDKGAAELNPNDIDWNSYTSSSGKPFKYRLRQEPGTDNSLGLIKFIFPNEYSIYLHDTPDRALFEKSQRDFSSGCIRVQNYQTFATLLLNEKRSESNKEDAVTALQTPIVDEPKDTEKSDAPVYPWPQVWNEKLVDQRLTLNKNEKVFLDEPMPVFIVYFTAWVDKESEIQFRDDIYDRDTTMQSTLAAEMGIYTQRKPTKQALLAPN